MSEHQHIILEGQARQVDYESSGFPRSTIVDRGDDLVHSRSIRTQYAMALEAFTQTLDQLPENVQPVDGIYLDFKINKSAKSEDKFNNTKAHLMNVRETEDGDEEFVTIYLPSNNRNWLSKKLNQYDCEPEGNAHRKNANLINSISTINSSDLKSFFTNSEEYERVAGYASEYVSEYEVWIDKILHDKDSIDMTLQTLNIPLCNKNVVFNDVVIYLIKATKDQLNHIVHSVKGISEIRIYKCPSVLTNARDMREQNEWIELIKADSTPVINPSRIAILDSGITNTHPLIEDFLPRERCHSVTLNGGLLDCYNHGTGLASLVLYGDLTDVIYQQQHVEVYSDLSSVKMIPGINEPENEQEMYAAVTEDAIITGRRDGAEILCSAVTSKMASKDGIPSSTSAAIDQTLYNDGACDSLMFISAGNVVDIGGVDYPDYLHNNPILDPAQTWNAISVGAFTQKTSIHNPRYQGAQVLAPCDGISPYSRTSTQWGRFLIKPEILMEGGNGILSGHDIDVADDLSLVCADAKPLIRKFTTNNATSAATAMAARLAGKIKYLNPNLSALSIRALLVHSANWTDKMLELFTENGILNKNALIHSCGYGVPDEKKAIASKDSYVTFIAEDAIQPFVRGANSLKFGHMNLYELPWPRETLLQMGETEVTLKITLSYYICPSPGNRGKLNKYTYQSLRLNFDVNGPTEELEAFKRRIKRQRDENEVRDDELTSRWTIGIKTRNQGSIISDKIEKTTAAQIASCNKIAIYPSGGWFKYYPDKENIEVKYSLVVSLETPEQEIFDEIATQIGIALPVNI